MAWNKARWEFRQAFGKRRGYRRTLRGNLWPERRKIPRKGALFALFRK